MIPFVYLNNKVNKELELGHQSVQRTQRWISDANQNVYESWYPIQTNQISESGNNLVKGRGVAETQPRWEVNNSILNRFSNLFNTRRQPVPSKS